MKCLLIILSILSVTCIGLVIGSPVRLRQDISCRREIYKQRLDQSDCVDNVYNETTFFNEMDELIHYYTNDESTIRLFANKYCPVLEGVLECLHLRHNISDECQIYNPEVESGRIRISKAVLNFVCENNAQLLMDIIPNDGLRTLGNSMLTSDCTKEIMQVDVEDKSYSYFKVNPVYCRTLKTAIKCQTEVEEIRGQSHLINALNGFHSAIRNEIGCRN